MSYSYIVYFTRDNITIYCLFFLIGLLSCWRLSLGYIYGQEIISETKSNIAGSIFNLFDATTVIFSSMFVLYISQSWVSLHSVYIVMITLSLVISLIMPESPKFLVSRKQYVQAAVSYNYIAAMNRGDFTLIEGLHRFKEQKSGDRKALKRHFKRTHYDINRGIGLDQPPIRKISEDEREYLSNSDVDDSKEDEEDLKHNQSQHVSLRSKSDDFQKLSDHKLSDHDEQVSEQRSYKTSIFGITENDFTMVDIFKDRTYMLNLVIISISWMASAVCFYIIGFYVKYIPGNVYSNIIIISVADALSSIGAGVVAESIGA